MTRLSHSESRHLNNEAKQAADELLKDVDIGQLPIDPFSIAERLGFTVHMGPTDNSFIAGYTEYRGNGTFEITISDALENEGLINFTLAHEIAHCAIGGHFDHLFGNIGSRHSSGKGEASSDVFERQADYFAACLLMPDALCRPLIIKHDDNDAGLTTVKILADKCRTSRNAAAIRYTALTDVPAAIFLSRDNCIQYCFMSEALLDQLPRNFQWPQRGAKVPKYMPSHKLGANKVAVSECQEPEGVAMKWSDWLDGVNGDAYEQCVGLGRVGKVLTVITSND